MHSLKDNDLITNQQLQEQVDILISKNQALKILYLKHCVYNETNKLPWIRNLRNARKFDLK